MISNTILKHSISLLVSFLIASTLLPPHLSYAEDSKYLDTNYPIHPQNGYVEGWGTWATAKTLAKAFFFTIDTAKGKGDAQDLANDVAGYFSPTSLIGMTAWTITFNSISREIAKQVGQRTIENAVTAPLVKNGISFVAWYAANDVDEIVENFITNLSKGEDTKTALSQALEKWKKENNIREKSIQVGTRIAGYAIAENASAGFRSAINAYRAQQTIRNSAQIASSASGSPISTILEMTAAYIISDFLFEEYIKLHDANFVSQTRNEIIKKASSPNKEKPEETFTAIEKNFSELRNLRKAWVQANDIDVKRAFHNLQDSFEELNTVRMTFQRLPAFNEFAQPSQLSETELPATVKCMQDITEIKRDWHEKNCLNDLEICRHLGRLKLLAQTIYNLEEKKRLYELAFQKIETRSTKEVHSYSGNLEPIKAMSADISKTTLSDLYQLERLAYSATIKNCGFEISKSDNTPLFTKDSINESERKCLKAYAQANNRSVIGESFFVNGKPVNKFDLITESKTLKAEERLSCQPPSPVDDFLDSVSSSLKEVKNLTPLQMVLADKEFWIPFSQRCERKSKIFSNSPELCSPKVINCIAAQAFNVEALSPNLCSPQGKSNCSEFLATATQNKDDSETINQLQKFLITFFSH